MQKKNHNKAFHIILIAVTLMILLIDIFVKVNISFENSSVIGTSITFLTIIYTLWFSYLLVVKQIYSNRYSSKLVGKYIYAGSKSLTIHFFVLLVIGFLLLILNLELFIFSLWYIINCIAYIFLCGKNIYKKIGDDEIKKVVKEKVKLILNSIDDNSDAKSVKREILRLDRIYDEAYLKNEATTCRIVIVSYYDFLKKYIETRNKNIIQNDEKQQEILKLLIAFQSNLLKKDSSDFAYELNMNIINMIYELAKMSVKCEIESLLMELMNVFYYALTFDLKISRLLFQEVYKYIYLLEKQAYEQDSEILFGKILEKSKSIFYAIKFEIGEADYIAFLRHLVSGLLNCIENKKENYYTKIYSEFENNIASEISIDNCSNVCILLSMILNKDSFNKNQRAKEDFIVLMKRLARNKTIYNNQFFAFVIYVVDKYKEIGEQDAAFELQYLYAKNIVESMVEAPNYIFPEFSTRVKNILHSEEKNQELSEKLDVLIAYAIEKNKTNWVGLLFSELIRVLKLTEQKDKNIQLIWIYLFQKALTNVSSANNSSMQELVLKYYKLAIFEMDKLKIISYDLSIKIIDNLRNLCEFRYRQNVDFSCEIVEFLDDLLDSENNLYFINNNKEIRGRIYRSLFDIAIDSIEKNQDLVIKRVSNVIGWRIKEMIEKGNSETADQLIDYALNMYNLCRDNKINEQTIVFVGTLFVIIGAFAGMEPKHYRYRNKIINELKKDNKNKEYLVVSKKIRQCEPLGWKGVLGRNPEDEFNKFWATYNKQ